MHATIFKAPPYSLPIEHALDFHLKENPDYTAIKYPNGNGSDGATSITFKELVPAIHRTGGYISEYLGIRPSSSPAPVVAILLQTDTLLYLTTIAGLMRAGCTPFPISSRFSPEVVTHLLKEAHPIAIIINDGTRALANAALANYPKSEYDPPTLCDIPPFGALYPGHNIYSPLPQHERKPEDISVIMHSSSTSSLFPKLIPFTSLIATHHGEVKDMPAHQFSGQLLGCFGLEMFHSYGMCVLFTLIRRGLAMAIMDPMEASSILPVDMDNVFRCFKAMHPSRLLSNPRVIEYWSQDPEKVAEFRNSGVNIHYGGRFLSKSVGDRLIRSGVKLSPAYGTTESGPIVIFPHFQGEDWEYWTMYPRPEVHFTPRDDGLFELFVAPTTENYLALSNTTYDGKPAYNPGDLFIAHPTKPNTYKVFGRSSDQIMLATGETINPVQIEEELSSHPAVSTVVMFGHTRFKVGMVIEPVNKTSVDEFLDEIWPTVETINQKFPSYSTITREMIVVTHSNKPISLSPKGLPRRPIVWLEYQDEIDACYAV